MDYELQPGQNTGFVEVAPKFEQDFIAGAETAILSTPVNPSCDWRPFLPTNVWQLMFTSDGKSHGDTNACVSFAGKQSIETQLNFKIKKGQLSADDLQWLQQNGYIDQNGSVLLSARFTARMSNTDPSVGNSLPTVWDSIKHDGMVPESVWPMPTKEFDALPAGATTQDFWNVYYKMPPVEAVNLGKAFAARFPVLYEWIIYPTAPESQLQILNDLSVSPVEIATAVCSGWNTANPIQGCGPGAQHATLLDFVENGCYDILDHYNPFQKRFAGNYSITYGMRGVITEATPAPQTFHYTFTKQLTFGDAKNDPTELHALQQALQYLKGRSGQPYMHAGVFGPFGPQTKAALAAFQADHGIPDPVPGADFGPMSRAAMNALVGA
jgi:hypothetical protein